MRRLSKRTDVTTGPLEVTGDRLFLRADTFTHLRCIKFLLSDLRITEIYTTLYLSSVERHTVRTLSQWWW